MKKFLGFLFALALLTSGCGGGGGSPEDEALNATYASSGDLTLSGTVVKSGSKLKLVLNPVINPANGEPISDLTASNFTITEAEGSPSLVSKADLRRLFESGAFTKGAITPSSFDYADSSSVKADVVFVFDTTGSMSEQIEGAKDSVETFAEKLVEGGVDARFALVTFGDTYNVINKDTDFTVGTGASSPPDFDAAERPFLDSTTVDKLKELLGELVAVGGGDLPEDSLGAVNFAGDSKNVTYRTGAARSIIVITDVCSHTPSTYKASFGSYEGYDTWLPPEPETLAEELQGEATVYVVGPAGEYANCSSGYFNMRQLADGKTKDDGEVNDKLKTGGKFIELPSSGETFDLSALGISGALTKSSTLMWEPTITTGTVTYTITVTYGELTGTLIIVIIYA